MVLLNFRPDEFFNYLGQNNCTKYSDKYIDEDVLIYEKDGFKMPIQLRSIYYPPYVCKVCEAFDIPMPDDFLKVKEQLDQLHRIQEQDVKKEDGDNL